MPPFVLSVRMNILHLNRIKCKHYLLFNFFIKCGILKRALEVKNFRAADYNEYNKKLGLFKYGYLHRLLDLMYKINLIVKDESLIMWESDTGNQAELKDTMYLDINERIKLHKIKLNELFKQRHKNIVRQLRLF